MSLSAEKLVAVLERRYDYHSARVVFRQVVARAGLSEGGPFGAPELERFATVLEEVGDRLGDLPEHIRHPNAKQAAPVKAEPAAPKAEPTPVTPEPSAKATAKAEAAPAAEPAPEAAAEPAAEAPAEAAAKGDDRHGHQQGKKKG